MGILNSKDDLIAKFQSDKIALREEIRELEAKNDIGIIKSEPQHHHYLQMVDELMKTDPPLDTPEGRRLELLAKLIEDYEKAK